jgi:hypothetical protein
VYTKTQTHLLPWSVSRNSDSFTTANQQNVGPSRLICIKRKIRTQAHRASRPARRCIKTSLVPPSKNHARKKSWRIDARLSLPYDRRGDTACRHGHVSYSTRREVRMKRDAFTDSAQTQGGSHRPAAVGDSPPGMRTVGVKQSLMTTAADIQRRIVEAFMSCSCSGTGPIHQKLQVKVFVHLNR